ncbi:isochorismatase family protein [Streptomyces broussonetiae]|uniref:isochorismatase family protein n=1 Tax=Streptomyces broussonetiae TaxID=2686304 RepID=UPI0035D6C07A
MSAHSKFLEPITRENAVVVLVDHQVGLLSGVRDIPLGELKHNVVAMARAATVLGIPLVVTTTAAESMWGPTIPELVKALPAGYKIIDRGTVNAWHDDRVREAIEATGRRKLIFAGVSLEVCAALPAISATAAGYDAYVAVDASGTFSQAKREAGLLRMQQAGVIVSDYATLMVEALADNAAPESAAVYGALDMPFAVLVGQISAAYRA